MIIDENTNNLLKELPKTSHGQALVRFLNQAKAEMNNVKTITSWDEALGRKNAVKVIDDLFSFMEEKKVEQVSKNQYI
jgi:hypothetical protein